MKETFVFPIGINAGDGSVLQLHRVDADGRADGAALGGVASGGPAADWAVPLCRGPQARGGGESAVAAAGCARGGGRRGDRRRGDRRRGDRPHGARPAANGDALGLGGFDFNVSHHGDYCVAAGCVAGGARIGVDVMKVEVGARDTPQTFVAAFRAQMTPAEWRAVNAAPAPPARLHAFLRLWCLKEAYTKALGLGLGVDFADIDVRPQWLLWRGADGRTDIRDQNIAIARRGVVQSGWFVHLAYIDPLHPYAIAINLPPDSTITPDDNFIKIEHVDALM
ncbi:hypothetical protein HK100_001537 [Physocladia obscura]|uniref:holo-[acyl-carrier-protein] synthase n=1 Tax=Physocladia obscura TaxID=109957 RepID=A0AAD5SXR7_9FUNG|nr:hypothetical protein HK100_001537 [Physocladia obscura]